ncbi:MAG: hypothetical protein NTV00_01795 [Methylococcales bacterium]|nr:hypothetical protein [Methylococcales bacterium]
MIKPFLLSICIFIFSAASYGFDTGNNFYFDAFSIEQGEELALYADYAATPTFNLKIYRLDTSPATYVTSISGVQSTPQVSNTEGYVNGAGWQKTTSIKIGSNWPSGFYMVQMFNPSDVFMGYATFTVKMANPGTYSRLLYLDNAPTSVAYNNWGGKSAYADNSSDSVAATSVSLKRPGQNYLGYPEQSFALWAKSNNIAVEYASMMDIENDPTLLSHYAAVIIAGHSEYWSKKMRDNFDDFIRNGGNGVILSGNTMWWQVRIEGDKMVAYKETAVGKDPLKNDPVLFDADLTNDATVTSLWSDPNGANRPENLSIGVSFRSAGFVNDTWSGVYLSTSTNTYGGYTPTNPNHWVFNNTALKNGAVFGKNAGIVGYETDGALYTVNAKGQYKVTGNDGTPINTAILSVSDAKLCNVYCTDGHATMVLTEPFPNRNSGLVFNAATVGWAYGLYNQYDGRPQPLGLPVGSVDPAIDQITKNVLNHFLYYTGPTYR